MNDNLQELVFVLEQSASIKDNLESATKNFKKFIADQKKLPLQTNVTIVTFNRDNASKKHTFEELAERIRHQTEVYKWQFYLITDFSINMEKLGISEENTIILKKSQPDAFKTAYEELNDKITALRTGE